MQSINDYSFNSFLMSGFKISDEAVQSDDANVMYYGFVNKAGEYYIMQQTRSGLSVAYRYIYGASGYTTAWTAREALTYEYFYSAFA